MTTLVSDHAAIIAALHEAPTDEVTWLALADWLEEDGQSERAELVRLVRQLRTVPVMERTRPRAALEGRVAALLNAGVKPVVPEIINSIGMRLALIPPGRFRMGSPTSEKDRRANETAHEVELTRPFYLGIYPVTQKQWREVMGTNPSWFCATGDGKDDVQGMNTDDFPVEQVSWEDAQTFLNTLNALAAEKETGQEYRLPSEAEWEYACRGGASSSTPFHFGQTLSSTRAIFNREQGRTCQVGSYASNAFGLYDMHGNVCEWCADWYGEYPEGAAIDPPGSPDGSYRVLRGGSWSITARYCRSAYRSRNSPEYRYFNLGFRVAMS